MAQFDNSGAEERVSLYGKNAAPGDTPLSTDASGNLNTNLISALPSGGNVIGAVKVVDAAGSNQLAIDGSGIATVKFATAQNVDIAAPLPAGTNLLGSFKLTDAGGVNQLAIDASGIASVKFSAALPAGTNTIGAVNVGAVALTSLSAATATGAGTSQAYTFARQAFALQVTSTGTPTAVIVNLEASLDGSHWFKVGAWNSTLQTTGDIVFVSDAPCYTIRANLATLTGGTSPTVTATVAAI